uniref:NADH-ubiquinone oxidoreductase chain 3 n=1 Tax=Ptilomera tigrina TaxID=1028187 RepID=A0A109NWV3_9HEMI|nr:NADH dehydrogenase subunit 3 [Ptilomera tigrina]
MIFMTMTTMMMSAMISMILMTLCAVISKNQSMTEKNNTIWMWIDPKSSARMPFSIQFFMIAIIFLIFDVEIIIILPTIKVMQMTQMSTWFITTSTFIIILIIGLYHEWKNGILEWSN